MTVKQPAVYIISNKKDGVLYTGVTSDLVKRIYEHKTKAAKGFTGNYNCNLLVFYEVWESMEAAIMREKQIKAGSRIKKLELIQEMNSNWKDLYEDIA